MAAIGCIAGLSLVLAACGGDDDDSANGTAAAENGDDADDTDTDPDEDDTDGADDPGDCAAYEQYGDLSGTTVHVYTSIVAPEDLAHIESYKPFEECTGATINYEGSGEFEAQLTVRVRGGNAPDIAYFPQPGLLETVVQDTGSVQSLAGTLAEEYTDLHFAEEWKELGTVDGTFYASPIGANVKSFVWYSPSMFADAGYEIPETWDEMLTLSDQIVADGNGKPWCAGIGSGDATGWPATDWMEDVMLRMHGPDVYDQWMNHDIPFNDPQVAEVLAAVGDILKNDDYVNGGLGDVRSIAATEFQAGGLPILDGNCWMHRQASFYQVNFTEAGATVAPDGDVYAFYLPPMGDDFGNPVLGGGEFAAAFDDRPEVQAFQAFLASPEWANLKAIEGNWISANTGLDLENVDTEINRLSVEILQDPETIFRFDASDLMPGEVGAGSFWTEMTNWIANDKPDDEVLDAIESSWPQ
nr:ABC transporter substrate-binding protein [Phytoactinopolyspora limicola]